MPAQAVQEYLANHHARYTVTPHPEAHSAQQIAHLTHTPGINMGKVIALRVDGELALLLLPAHYHIDLEVMAYELGAFLVELAPEDEFQREFPECEPGAMPPFGEMWGVPLYMCDTFHQDEPISFNAGNWTEIISMNFDDFFVLAEPILIYEAAVLPPGVEAFKQSANQ